jgi:hypothetical protein
MEKETFLLLQNLFGYHQIFSETFPAILSVILFHETPQQFCSSFLRTTSFHSADYLHALAYQLP